MHGQQEINYIDRRAKTVLDLVTGILIVDKGYTWFPPVACKGQTIYPNYLFRKVFMTQLARPMAIHLPILFNHHQPKVKQD